MSSFFFLGQWFLCSGSIPNFSNCILVSKTFKLYHFGICTTVEDTNRGVPPDQSRLMGDDLFAIQVSEDLLSR